VRRTGLPRAPPARRVAGDDRGLEPVQLQRLEGVLRDQHDALWHVAVAGERLVDPVADIAHLERAPLHAAEADLARETAAVSQEHAEAVRGVEVALAIPGSTARTERLAVERGIDAPGLGTRLPPFEPFATPKADLAPALPVLGAQRAQHDSRPAQLGHAVTSTASRIASTAAGSSSPETSPRSRPVATARIARRRI